MRNLHFDSESSPGNLEEGSVEEVVLELGGVEGSTHDDDFEVRSTLGDIFEETHEDVGGEGTFVRLVEDDGRVPRQHVVVHRFAEEHTVGHVLEESLGTGAVLEPDAVTDFVSERDVHLVGDTLGDTHGGNSTGLRARDLEPGSPQVRQIGVGNVLRDSIQ